ncbi:MAG: hypothetical protein NTNFB02_23380 [Nitrospira sp.]
MRIRGRVITQGTHVADAKVRIWLVKRSDAVEVPAFDGWSTDNGTFECTQDMIDNIVTTSRNFIHVKYSVEKKGYRSVSDVVPFVDVETNLADIEFPRSSLRIRGRVVSNRRPVSAAKIIVRIAEVERGRIRADHNGQFERDIEGHYESQPLVWTARRLGYIRATGNLEIRSNQLDFLDIDLTPRWWMGLCQIWRLDPEVVPGVLLSVLFGLIFVGWLVFRCPDPTVKAQDFTKGRADDADRGEKFRGCLSRFPDKCGTETDSAIIKCMKEKGYQYAK